MWTFTENVLTLSLISSRRLKKVLSSKPHVSCIVNWIAGYSEPRSNLFSSRAHYPREFVSETIFHFEIEGIYIFADKRMNLEKLLWLNIPEFFLYFFSFLRMSDGRSAAFQIIYFTKRYTFICLKSKNF